MSRTPQSLNSEMNGILREVRRPVLEVAAVFDAGALERERQLRLRILLVTAASVLASIGLLLLQ